VAALDQVDVAATDAGALAGLVEKHARLAGAEEAYIAIAPDLDLDRRLIQVSGPDCLALRVICCEEVGSRRAARAAIRSK
jgi:hypothetical protein